LTCDRKAKTIALEFPYGEGIAAEVILTPEKAIALAQSLVTAATELGWKP
jgi:hypothetical protein